MLLSCWFSRYLPSPGKIVAKLSYLSVSKLLPVYTNLRLIAVLPIQISSVVAGAADILFWVEDTSLAGDECCLGVTKVMRACFDPGQDVPSVAVYSEIVINVPQRTRRLIYLAECKAVVFAEKMQIVMKGLGGDEARLRLKRPMYDLIQVGAARLVGCGVGRAIVVSAEGAKLSLAKVLRWQ